MSPDLKAFCEAMDGEWQVVRYELDGDRVRVHYSSLTNLSLSWSMTPFASDIRFLPAVGSIGRIGFIKTRGQ